ncbi:hypothetical protein [Rhodococcoides fascians]|uniref:hypothetical protein n=1 Tax=Rhodococcoides fascians TaxID=1828 RepID=UPI00068D0611|nr:hypothetical protein [Rhodococcus fascians]
MSVCRPYQQSGREHEQGSRDHDRVDIGTLRYAIEIATAVHLSRTRIGCADTDVLAATAPHDTVEDQAESIVDVLGAAQDLSAQNALLLIEREFGHETARLVAAAGNPPAPHL